MLCPWPGVLLPEADPLAGPQAARFSDAKAGVRVHVWQPPMVSLVVTRTLAHLHCRFMEGDVWVVLSALGAPSSYSTAGPGGTGTVLHPLEC